MNVMFVEPLIVNGVIFEGDAFHLDSGVPTNSLSIAFALSLGTRIIKLTIMHALYIIQCEQQVVCAHSKLVQEEGFLDWVPAR